MTKAEKISGIKAEILAEEGKILEEAKKIEKKIWEEEDRLRAEALLDDIF
jgi:hypothetical protein